MLTPAPPPPTRPRLAVGDDAFYVKPILAIAGGVHVENLIQTLNKNRESRMTTLALTRFGVEGKLGPYVSFRSEFERNLRAHGSGIWEGTASFSARDQYIRLQRWGATADAGIILDPASVDFISTHIADVAAPTAPVASVRIACRRFIPRFMFSPVATSHFNFALQLPTSNFKL